MESTIKRPELLAPAGDLEILKTAITYGADAVYMGGKAFGMRATAATFDYAAMEAGLDFAHARGAKCYITVNAIPHNREIDALPEYLEALNEIKVDAIIVADLGAFAMAKRHAPDTQIHVSVQANITNYAAALEWARLGASRIIVSREISLTDIARIRKELPKEVAIEAFVHGAMCLSYSGRCYLSSYIAGRDANHGECVQPCRSMYHLMEERRPNDFFPVYEDENGAYILNSNDLCMIEHIPEMLEAGIESFKIEGRAKTAFYSGTVVRAYRSAIDGYLENPQADYKVSPALLSELQGVSHRTYDTGFYLGTKGGQNVTSSTYIREFDVVGVVIDVDKKGVTLQQRNKFSVGDTWEVLDPDGNVTVFSPVKMFNVKGDEILSAPHAQMLVFIPDLTLTKGAMVRKRAGVEGLPLRRPSGARNEMEQK